MYIEESFDTIFNMGYGESYRTSPPPPWLMHRKNRPCFKGLIGKAPAKVLKIIVIMKMFYVPTQFPDNRGHFKSVICKKKVPLSYLEVMLYPQEEEEGDAQQKVHGHGHLNIFVIFYIFC